jgi:hypothetical protein
MGAEPLMTIFRVVSPRMLHRDSSLAAHRKAVHTLPAKFVPETVMMLPAYTGFGVAQNASDTRGDDTICRDPTGVSATNVEGFEN